MRVKAPREENKSWLETHLRQLRKLSGCITRLQVSLGSNLFLIAPIPTQQELDGNLAWCDWSARRFFTWTQNHHSLTPNDFLIMPTTFDGKKPLKGNTQIGQEIVASAAQSDHISHFICVGSDAFKTYMGFGKAPSMPSLVGNTTYLEVVNHKPVFVFPDIGPIRMDPDGHFIDKKDWFFKNQACQRLMNDIERISEDFGKFLEAKKVR
jgi:hypothetical protein